METISREIAKQKGLRRYFTGKPCIRGHVVERKASTGQCVSCASEDYKKYINTEKGYAKKLAATKQWKSQNKERIKVKHTAWAEKNWKRVRFLYLRSAAKQRGHAFNLSQDDLHYPAVCPALGIPLDYSPKGKFIGPQWNSPSVDRIDSNKGYIKGNVVVVSQLANSIKTCATPAQIMRVALFYEKLLTSTK